MKYLKMTVLLFVLGGIGMLGIADAATVQNNISVKASTGGNSSASGSSGKSEASVFVETIVDGQVVTHVDETKKSETGEPVEIEKHIEYIDGKEVTVDSTVNAHAQSETINESSKVIHQESSSEEIAEIKIGKQEQQEQTESKSLFVTIINFFKSLWGRFLA
jgi:hypothetical protein